MLHNSLLHLLLKNCDFLNIDSSQGSVATRLGKRIGGLFKYGFVTNFLLQQTLQQTFGIGDTALHWFQSLLSSREQYYIEVPTGCRSTHMPSSCCCLSTLSFLCTSAFSSWYRFLSLPFASLFSPIAAGLVRYPFLFLLQLDVCNGHKRLVLAVVT